jgi:hypothetical protein
VIFLGLNDDKLGVLEASRGVQLNFFLFGGECYATKGLVYNERIVHP